MGSESVSKKIDQFWISKGVNPVKTDGGYYMMVMQTWKLYIYPEDLGATFMVIPTSKKYFINRNLDIGTELGAMIVDANPNRSNPALLFGVKENALNNNYIDKVISCMVNIVENQFDKFQSHQ